MRISRSKVVILSLIFAIVLSLTLLTVTTVVLSELENTAENVDEILLPIDDAQVLQAYLDSNYGAIIPPTTPYEHVILIVVDGVRPDILVGADTPNIDNLIASGSFTWNAWTVTPSVTIAAVPSIYTGATPEVHGVTDWHGEIYAETIVEVFEEAGLPCAIVGQDPILGGYSATYCTGYYSHPQADEHFMTLAIDLLWENDFYFISIYDPMPDKRGHGYGHDSPEYREAIENADYHIGRLVENLKELGVYENTLIVITTDHGMTGTSHGHGYETDMRIFSVWHGPGVKQGYEMADLIYIPASGTYDETYVAHRIIDIAPTMTELVGVRPPENAEGEVIRQIFEGALTPHAPIYIDGDDNFIPANGVVSGSGTENDPYVIENWEISAENAYGIEIRNTTAYFVVRNCVVENGGGAYDGIYLYNVVNGRIENCTVENNYCGIRLISDNNIIKNNTCSNNEFIGICLFFSSNNITKNNTCENNESGIYLYDSSNNITENNTCENNLYGIYLRDSSDNSIIRNNKISNNDNGICLVFSNNNRIYHNNFINNGTQASVFFSTSYWDDGYPSGGNYWSDYTGEDIYRGENQDIPGSDGIGDTPYIIPGGNQDRYPLMNPIAAAHTEQVPPGTTVVDARDETDTMVKITTDQAGSVTAVKYENNPGDPSPSGFTALGKYVEVRTDIPSDNIVWPIEIRIYYTDEEVAEVGIPENILRISYWDGSNWVEEPDSGVDVENNYVWARVTHLSPFAPIGIIWKGTTAFRLENLYTVGLDENLDLRIGSKLVVKFYQYDNVTLQDNSVIDEFTPPHQVKENENVPHPQGVPVPPPKYPGGTVQIAKLVLTTENTANEISTIASFTVHQSDLKERFLEILGEWFPHPELHDAFRAEVKDILSQWFPAPP